MLAGASQILVVTFISAVDIRKKTSFFCEIWTEPLESVPKPTRLHHHASGNHDLGAERLELDWYRDETEVVLQVSEFTSKLREHEIPFGEVRIPRKSIEKYAAQAKGHQDDFSMCAKAFPVMPMLDSAVVASMRRKQGKPDPDPAFLAVVASLQDKMGVQDELRALKSTNEKLKKDLEHTTLALKSSGSQVSLPSAAKEEVMKLVLKFEIVQKVLTNARGGGHEWEIVPADELSTQSSNNTSSVLCSS